MSVYVGKGKTSDEEKSKVKSRRSSLMLTTAGLIAILAGVIFIFSGYTSHPILLIALSYIESHFSNLLPPAGLESLKFSITVLNFLVSLGGIVVIIGGTLILLKHRSLGRILIWLGGGVGILGLLFTMGEAYYYSGFSLATFHSEYWIGLALATLSSILAKKG